MVKAKKITVNMTQKALTDFVFRSYYSRFTGFLSIFLGFLAIMMLVRGAGKISLQSIIVYAVLAAICLIGNPLVLMMKARKQLRTNPSYKAPITYEIDLAGITVSQGEQQELIQWKNIFRIRYSKNMVAVYTSPYHAFVLPNSELGNDKEIILGRLVQYTLPYKPRLSLSLKEFAHGSDSSKNIQQ